MAKGVAQRTGQIRCASEFKYMRYSKFDNLPSSQLLVSCSLKVLNAAGTESFVPPPGAELTETVLAFLLIRLGVDVTVTCKRVLLNEGVFFMCKMQAGIFMCHIKLYNSSRSSLLEKTMNMLPPFVSKTSIATCLSKYLRL